MKDIAIEAGLAAIAAAAITQIWLDIHQASMRAWRERHRIAGSGPYEPTHDIPDVDLAVAIAEHLRLKYIIVAIAADTSGLIDALNHAYRISLRAATIIAHALNDEGGTT